MVLFGFWHLFYDPTTNALVLVAFVIQWYLPCQKGLAQTIDPLVHFSDYCCTSKSTVNQAISRCIIQSVSPLIIMGEPSTVA